MELKENLLLQYHDGRTIRIVYYERLSSIVYAIDMNQVRWPFLIREDELFSDYQKEKISVLESDPYMRYFVEEELSDAEKERRNQAWEIVNFLLKQVDSASLIFKSKYRNLAIKEAIQLYKVSYNTVKNYLIRYWKGGMIRNSLLSNFHLCGAPGIEKGVSKKKRGRPKQSVLNKGINIDDKIKKYFKTGLNRYYYNGRQNSLKVTYELILKDFFTETKVDIGMSTLNWTKIIGAAV